MIGRNRIAACTRRAVTRARFVRRKIAFVTLIGAVALVVPNTATAQFPVTTDSLRVAAEAAERAGNAREALRLYVQHQKHFQHAMLGWRADSAASLPFAADSAIYAKIFQLASRLDPPPTLPDSAMVYEVRAQHAFDAATTNDGFTAAESEYGGALYHAPWVPRFWWNVALIREKRGYVAGAATILKVYLSSPQIEDRDAVRRKLIGFEYDLERAAAAAAAATASARQAAEMAGRTGGGVLAVGVPASGILAAGDSTLSDNSYFDTWFFTAEAGQRVRVRMTSSAFAPSVYVFWNSLATGIHGAMGRGIAEVSDLRVRGPGTFFVRTNSAGTGARTGPYTIVVERVVQRQ